MSFLLGLLLLVTVASPWNWLAFVVCFVLGWFEVGFWWRTVRNRRIEAGSETLIGKRARVVAACRPRGQVWVDGERWEATCAAGAAVGDEVTIVSRDGLILVVEPSVPDDDLESDDRKA